MKELNDFEPRYDPTVVPIAKYPDTEFRLNALESLVAGGGGAQRGSKLPYGVVDYHSAYKNGEYTPTAVAKALLQLISHSASHGTAFLQIREARVLEAAEASTRRYQDGLSRSVLDGVPVGVKDEVDLDGYEKSLGSSQDFTRPGGGTSWCVKKWEEAGAVIIGKLNMHEFGLGKNTTRGNYRHGSFLLTVRKTPPTTTQPKAPLLTHTISTITRGVLPADPGMLSARVWFPLRWAPMVGARSDSQPPSAVSMA